MKKLLTFFCLLLLIPAAALAQPPGDHQVLEEVSDPKDPYEEDSGAEDCNKFKLSTNVAITAAQFINVDCVSNELLQVSISNAHYTGSIHVVLTPFLQGQPYGNPIVNQVFMTGNSVSSSFNLLPVAALPAFEGGFPVTYQVCVVDLGSNCKLCKSIEVVYHKGAYVELEPIGPPRATDCKDNRITYGDLLAVSPGGPSNSNPAAADNLVWICCSGTSFSATVEWSIGASISPGISFGIQEAIEFQLGIDLGVEQVFSQSFSFEAPDPDNCFYYCISDKVQDYLVKSFEFDPTKCADAYSLSYSEHKITVPVTPRSSAIRPVLDNEIEPPCNLKLKTEPKYQQTPNGTQGYIEPEIEDVEGIFRLEWQGPNGFDSEELNIYNLEPGEYCLFIEDICCNQYEKCVIVCPEATYEDWYFNEKQGTYCRELECADNPGLTVTNSKKTSNTSLTECLDIEDVEFTPWSFDFRLKLCTRDVLYEGNVIDQQTQNPTIVDRYDELTEQCVREYFCGEATSSADHSDLSLPTFGNWQFDFAQELCFREITCFGGLLTNQRDQKEPETEWEYNSVTDLCAGTLLCDGTPVITAPMVSQFPSNFGAWEYDEFTGKCTRTAQCDASDLNSVVQQEEEPQISWSFNAFSNQCEGTVICDGSEVWGATFYEAPASESQWTLSLDGATCTKKVYCGPNQEETEVSIDATFQNSGITGNGSNGCPSGNPIFYVLCDNYNTGTTVCGTGFKPETPGSNAKNDASGFEISLNPNPFHAAFQLTFSSPAAETYELKISSMNGTPLIQRRLESFQGMNHFTFHELEGEAKGVYILTLTSLDGKLIARKKLVKT